MRATQKACNKWELKSFEQQKRIEQLEKELSELKESRSEKRTPSTSRASSSGRDSKDSRRSRSHGRVKGGTSTGTSARAESSERAQPKRERAPVPDKEGATQQGVAPVPPQASGSITAADVDAKLMGMEARIMSMMEAFMGKSEGAKKGPKK